MIVLLFLAFTSRVPYEPLVAKLTASGGDRGRIVQVKASADLMRQVSGKRYKFVVDEKGTLAIAPLPWEAPNNEYVHPILAGGAPVLTAGGIVIEHSGGKPTKVIVDQESKSYCPTLQSLDEAVRVLEKLGVPSRIIERNDHPALCAGK